MGHGGTHVARKVSVSCFVLYLEKVENGAKFLETTMMVIGSNDTEFGYQLKFVTNYNRQI